LTKHRTVPQCTTLDPKVLGDGIDQTPWHTNDPDTYTISANNSAVTPFTAEG